MTNRFAGVNFLNCSSGFCSGFFASVGVCMASALRRLDCGFFDFCVEGGLGARKRCGEGVWVGIGAATLMDAGPFVWVVGGAGRNASLVETCWVVATARVGVRQSRIAENAGTRCHEAGPTQTNKIWKTAQTTLQ